MDPRDAIGKLMSKKIDGRELRKRLDSLGIGKASTPPVQSGAKGGAYVPATPKHYDKMETVRYMCPVCDRVYEARSDIDAGELRCQYHTDTKLKPVKPKAATDGDEREKSRHAQVNKGYPGVKHNDAFAEGS